MFLKDFRKSLCLTQGALAKELGCSTSAICKFEKGISKMPDSLISKVEERYGVVIEPSLSEVEQLKVKNKELNKQLREVTFQLYLANLRARNLQKDVFKLYKQLGDFIKRMKVK